MFEDKLRSLEISRCARNLEKNTDKFPVVGKKEKFFFFSFFVDNFERNIPYRVVNMLRIPENFYVNFRFMNSMR
jgi:hypothetical protein